MHVCRGACMDALELIDVSLKSSLPTPGYFQWLCVGDLSGLPLNGGNPHSLTWSWLLVDSTPLRPDHRMGREHGLLTGFPRVCKNTRYHREFSELTICVQGFWLPCCCFLFRRKKTYWSVVFHTVAIFQHTWQKQISVFFFFFNSINVMSHHKASHHIYNSRFKAL